MRTNTESYQKMKKRHHDEINAFPMFFAFSREQFAEGMKQLGLEPEDTDKIYKLGSTGGFYRREDAKDLHEMFRRHEEEMREARADEGFAFEMFRYELANHEFCVRHDPEPTLDALGLTMEQVKNDEVLREAWEKALEEYRA